MKSRKHFQLLVIKVLFLLVFSVNVYGGEDTSIDWLMKMNMAANNTNFHGSFVYFYDGQVESMEVTRRAKNGAIEERLFSLNGEPREVIRDADRVWCYIPNSNMVVHDHRRAVANRFPDILGSDPTKLLEIYKFIMDGEERIANQQTIKIRIQPKDEYRFGYILWLDKSSGLLLKSDFLDEFGSVLEHYMFVNISDEQLEAISPTQGIQQFGRDTVAIKSVNDSKWQLKNTPKGFSISENTMRMSPIKHEMVEHIVLTDGLSSVSIFVKPISNEKSSMMGVSRMGAMNAFQFETSDHTVTVMGEVPSSTISLIAENLSYQKN